MGLINKIKKLTIDKMYVKSEYNSWDMCKPVIPCEIDYEMVSEMVKATSEDKKWFFATQCKSEPPDYTMYQIDFMGKDGHTEPLVAAISMNDYNVGNLRDIFYSAVARGRNFRYYENYAEVMNDAVNMKARRPKDDILIWGVVGETVFVIERAKDFNELKSNLEKEVVKLQQAMRELGHDF